MKEYGIVKKSPDMDYRDMSQWNGIPELKIDTLMWTDETDITAGAQLVWDENALYVHLFAKEKYIRAEENSLLGMPCADSCLEFFFSPKAGDPRYFNIEYNPNLCRFLGYGNSTDDLVRLLPDHEDFAPIVNRREDGWEIAYRVPTAFIRLFFGEYVPEAGRQIRANCYKCGDATVKTHYLAWNPIGPGKHSFHRPEDFGKMVFLG